jgi:hypothetical protein
LRYCPIVHQTWLSLIDAAISSPPDQRLPGLALHSLPRPTFDTQRAQILRSEYQPINEPIKGISVLCATDASGETQGAVVESDRGQVLDGIIRYGDQCVIVLESKLHESFDDRQARNLNLHGQPIRFDSPVRKISWQNVLASFTDLADQDRGLVSGAEREILNDFLAFIERNFPHFGVAILPRNRVRTSWNATASDPRDFLTRYDRLCRVMVPHRTQTMGRRVKNVSNFSS